MSVSGLNFRPNEIMIVSNIPLDVDIEKDVNTRIAIYDEIKEPIERYGSVIYVSKNSGGMTPVNLGTRNAFKINNDGFYFNRDKSIFKAGYTYTWYAIGKRDMITEGCFVLKDDTNTITIDFDNVNPKSFTIFAESGILAPTEDAGLVKDLTLNKPIEGVTNDCNLFVTIKKVGDQHVFAGLPHVEWETTLQDGHYKLQLSLAEMFGADIYEFAKGVVYRWVAIS